MYDFMCNRLDHLIARKKTNYRSPITTSERLSLTLNFLTTGGQYNIIRNGYVAAKPSVSKLVAETCAAIIEEFQDEVFHTPSTEPEWKAIAERFLDRWNFPHCVGALDGKHIRKKKPDNSGTLFYNYKKYFDMSRSELRVVPVMQECSSTVP